MGMGGPPLDSIQPRVPGAPALPTARRGEFLLLSRTNRAVLGRRLRQQAPKPAVVRRLVISNPRGRRVTWEGDAGL